MLTSKALTRAGFGDVEIMDRRTSKEKSRFGGYELSCRLMLGSLPAKVIVKVLSRDTIRQRQLDELAGSVMRSGADAGLIVSPYPLPQALLGAVRSYRPLKIHVIDGPLLAELLTRSSIGIGPKGRPDFAFFSELEDTSLKIQSFMRRECV
jgi:hypothetical protein